MHADLRCWHGVELIVNGRSWTGKVEDRIHLDVQRHSYIVPQRFEHGVGQEMGNVGPATSEIVVNAKNFSAGFQQSFTQERPQESGTARDEHALSVIEAVILHGRTMLLQFPGFTR